MSQFIFHAMLMKIQDLVFKVARNFRNWRKKPIKIAASTGKLTAVAILHGILINLSDFILISDFLT